MNITTMGTVKLPTGISKFRVPSGEESRPNPRTHFFSATPSVINLHKKTVRGRNCDNDA